MMYPNFFIIGAPKCGTTALAQYLSENPYIFFSGTKEPLYFSFDLMKTAAMDLEAYLSLFKGADPGVHQAVGEGSAVYLFSRTAVSEILKFNPEARFIVLLRNPVDLVQAWHSQKIFEGREDILDFERAWRAEGERRNGKRIPASCWEPKDLFYSEWGLLGGQMKRLLERVPKSRVKVILFEDFNADPAKTYRETLDFLGVRWDGRTRFERINENKRLIWPPLQLFFGFLAQCAWWIKKELRLTRKWGIVSGLLSWNTRAGKRPPVSPAFQSELEAFYKADVSMLSDLLGRDLSHWTSSKDA